MKKKFVLLLLVGGALAGGVVGAARYIYKISPVPNIVRSFGSTGSQEGSSSVDLSDDRNLLGIAHNFFVGKVESQGAPVKLSIFTLHPYTIDVVLNIKGNLQGTVTVYTHGLQPGSTYLLGTRWNENDWGLTTAFLDGRELISSDQALTSEQLNTLAESNPKVLAAQKAYPDEISYYGDVMHNTTYNSYKTRRYDASGQLIDDTAVLREQYVATHPAVSTEVAPVTESGLPTATPAPFNNPTPIPVRPPIATPVPPPPALTPKPSATSAPTPQAGGPPAVPPAP